MNYDGFLHGKVVTAPESGMDVKPEELSRKLKPHQRDAVIWALKGGRRGYTIELNNDYFRDAVGYLKEQEERADVPTLFDFLEGSCG